MRNSEENILSILAGTNPSDLNADQRHLVHEWRNDSIENENLFEALSFIEEHKADFVNYKSFETKKKFFSYVPKLILLLVILAMSYFTLQQLGLIHSTTDSTEIQMAFLDDHTEIHLMDGATIAKSLGFNKTDRVVYLKGNAFFDVSHNKELPFIIKQHSDEIEVLGTSFDVVRKKDGLQVSVYDGKVKLTNDLGEYKVLEEGQSAIAGTHAVNYTDDFIANRTLVTKSYKNVNVHDILLDLKVSFDFDISFNENIRTATCRYNGSFEQASLTEILEEFSLIFKMEYHIENQEIVIDSLRCN